MIYNTNKNGNVKFNFVTNYELTVSLFCTTFTLQELFVI